MLVDAPTGGGEFVEAARLAVATVASLRAGGMGEVTPGDWWRTRAVVSGALPGLTPRERAEGLRAVLGIPDGARPELDTVQLKEGRALLQAAVVRAVGAASAALGETAQAWRRAHVPRWTDAVPGDRGDALGAGDEDGAEDLGGDTSEDSGDEGRPDEPGDPGRREAAPAEEDRRGGARGQM